MNLSTFIGPKTETIKAKSSPRKPLRQLAAGLICLSMAACSSAEKEELGKIGYVQGFIGGVSIDEPNAAEIGRDILSAGGTAADAVTAMYFMSSVTMPSTASLGGGGVCVVYDRESNTAEAIDFLTRTPKTISQTTQRPTGIPMNARGFFILQSKYGALRWGQLIAPAEQKARFGVQVSRALASHLNPVASALIKDGEAARVFAKADGTAVREGDIIRQYDLAATLTEIRSKGPGALYVGSFANRFVDAVNEAGGSITKQDLRDALPVWRETMKSLDYKYKVAHFAPPAAAGGVVGAQIWSMLAKFGDLDSADEVTRNHILAEAAQRAYGDRARWVHPSGQNKIATSELLTEDHIERLMVGLNENRHTPSAQLRSVPVATPETPSALSMAAVDRYGMGVSCNVTMNNSFGVGRIAPGTGILLSALPGLNGRGPMSLGPVIVANTDSKELYFAGAASGGVTAPTALVNVAARIIMAGQTPEEAMQNARVHHGGVPDILYHEPSVAQNDVVRLQAMGYQTEALSKLGLVSAISCKDGLHTNPQTCQVLADPRGYGLAVGAQ
jgi:gamma-glutamyltranspeptidase/glutathione hydrolase